MIVPYLFVAGVAAADDWPSFRGPTGMGVTTEKDLPLEWGTGSDAPNLLWQAPLPPTTRGGEPDHNQSSPVVADGKVIVTTAHWAPDTEKEKSAPEHRVACYDARTGDLLWDSEVAAGPLVLDDLRGGYAAPTPAASDGRVFALFGSAIVHALDFEGSLLWSHTLKDHDQFDVALAASPVVYRDTVILLLDRKKPAATAIALDMATGEVRWEKGRPDTDFGHMTPVLTKVGEKVQLLVTATDALQGLDPENGEVLWSCEWGAPIWPVSSPVVADGLVYAIGGRGGHPGAVVDPGGTGDVTETHLKWKIGPMSEGLSSPVAFEDRVYRLNSPGILRCFSVATGDELYRERLPDANHRVSPFVTPEGHLYFATAGKSVVVKAGDTMEILAESDLGDPSDAAAAVADGTIFLKGSRSLHAIRAARP